MTPDFEQLPQDYLAFLKNHPNGNIIVFDEYGDDDPDYEGRDWQLMGKEELLTSWDMKGVGKARNFECLQLYVKVQKMYAEQEWTSSNRGNILLDRIAQGFVIGEENGDYLYLDPADDFSVWIYYHDGGDVLRIAHSFQDFYTP